MVDLRSQCYGTQDLPTTDILTTMRCSPIKRAAYIIYISKNTEKYRMLLWDIYYSKISVIYHSYFSIMNREI